MEIEEIKDILSRTSIFNGLDEVQRTLIAHICHFKQYNFGVDIIKEGDAGDGLYIIVQGKVSVFLPEKTRLREDERFSDVKLNTLIAGNCFGEYSLLDGHYVSATVEALE